MRHFHAFDLAFARHYREHHARGVVADRGDHLVKHIRAGNTEFVNRFALSIGVKLDAVLEVVHSVKVIHPFGIDVFKQQHTLDFAHPVAEHLFLGGVQLHRALAQHIGYVLGF